MIGTLLSNRYRIEAKLGEGGMGVVCKAHDTLLDRPVAIKSLSPQLFSKEGLKRLLREAQSAAKLAHPNIVATHDVLEDGDSRHIVMEFVEGKTLRDFIPMPWRDAGPLMRQVFEAIEFAHEHGIIHRDLSMYARWKAGKRPTPEPMEWAPDTNVFDVADQIRCPILLAYGALEPEKFRSQAEELAAVVPTAIVRPGGAASMLCRMFPRPWTTRLNG